MENVIENVDVIAYVFWAALAFAVLWAVWLRVMRQRCDQCRTWVDRYAIRCRHCGTEFD